MENPTKSSSSSSSSSPNYGKDDIAKVFDRIDENGDGKITASELGKVVGSLGPGSTESEVEVMIQEMDTDRDGLVDAEEYAEFNRGGGGSGEVKDAFDVYDLNGNGVISAKELHDVMEKMGEKCSVEDCERMIRNVDRDGDGCVNFDEFKKMMRGGIKKLN